MSKEHIICAFAEPADGPGWRNSPLWYVTRDGNGNLRLECLQPEDHTPEIAALYAISNAVHVAVVRAVRMATAKPKKRRDGK